MSEPETRGPEDHDAPLEWRAPSNLSGSDIPSTAIPARPAGDTVSVPESRGWQRGQLSPNVQTCSRCT